MKKSIALNAFLNTLQTIISIIFPLITYPYCSRILGVEGIGKYGFSYSIISYFVLLAGLGIKTYAIREGARLRENKENFEQFISEIFSINIYSTFFSYVFLGLILLISNKMKTYALLMTILSLQIFFTTIGKDYLYVINENYLYITIRQIVFHIVSLVLLFLFVKGPEDLALYCFVSVSGVIFSNIVNYFDSKKYAKIHFILKPNWCHIKPILLIFSASIGVVIYGSSDITILGILGSDYNVGIYNTSVKIYSTVKQAVAAILIVSIPRFSFYLGKKDIQSYRKLFENLFNILIYIILPTIIGLSLISKEIIILIAGVNFIGASTSLKILSIAMIFNLISYMYGYCILIPNRKDKEFMIATFIGAIVNIVFNIILIPKYFENAAAFTTVIAEISVFTISIYFSRKILLNKINIKELISIFIGCCWIIFIVILIKRTITNNTLILIYSIISASLGYFLITYMLGNSSINELLLIVKSKIKLIK